MATSNRWALFHISWATRRHFTIVPLTEYKSWAHFGGRFTPVIFNYQCICKISTGFQRFCLFLIPSGVLREQRDEMVTDVDAKCTVHAEAIRINACMLRCAVLIWYWNRYAWKSRTFTGHHNIYRKTLRQLTSIASLTRAKPEASHFIYFKTLDCVCSPRKHNAYTLKSENFMDHM